MWQRRLRSQWTQPDAIKPVMYCTHIITSNVHTSWYIWCTWVQNRTFCRMNTITLLVAEHAGSVYSIEKCGTSTNNNREKGSRESESVDTNEQSTDTEIDMLLRIYTTHTNYITLMWLAQTTNVLIGATNRLNPYNCRIIPVIREKHIVIGHNLIWTCSHAWICPFGKSQWQLSTNFDDVHWLQTLVYLESVLVIVTFWYEKKNIVTGELG